MWKGTGGITKVKRLDDVNLMLLINLRNINFQNFVTL